MNYSAAFFFFALILSSCTNYEEHNYLGTSPAIAKKYYEAIEKLNKELLKITEPENAKSKVLEITRLNNEADKELKEYFHSIEKMLLIPFIQEVNRDLFEIRQIEIKDMSYNKIDISATFVSMVETRNSLFCYMKFIDKDGNELPGWIVMFSHSNLVKGNSYAFTGTYTGLHNLGNAATLIVKTATDFQNSASFNN